MQTQKGDTVSTRTTVSTPNNAFPLARGSQGADEVTRFHTAPSGLVQMSLKSGLSELTSLEPPYEG